MKNNEKNKAHNMLFLLSDLGFKNLCIVFHVVLSKARPLLKNIIEKPCIPCC